MALETREAHRRIAKVVRHVRIGPGRQQVLCHICSTMKRREHQERPAEPVSQIRIAALREPRPHTNAIADLDQAVDVFERLLALSDTPLVRLTRCRSAASGALDSSDSLQIRRVARLAVHAA